MSATRSPEVLILMAVRSPSARMQDPVRLLPAPAVASSLPARWVYDPPPVAGAAQVQAQPAVDLVQRFLLRQACHAGEELLDLLADVPGQILLGNDRRPGVGHRLDGDAVEV